MFTQFYRPLSKSNWMATWMGTTIYIKDETIFWILNEQSQVTPILYHLVTWIELKATTMISSIPFYLHNTSVSRLITTENNVLITDQVAFNL